MPTQHRRSACQKIVVEVPELWLKHMATNPDLCCSGAQPFRCALPRRITVDGDVEALQSFRQPDGSKVTRRESGPDGKAGGRLGNGQHGLDAFTQCEDVVTWAEPDGIA